MITLGNISTKNLNGNFRIEVPVTMNGETRSCWYELPDEYQNMVAEDRCDAFIAAILLPALYSGEDITCEAPVSARFLYNLNNELIPTLNAFFPRLHKISIIANNTTEQTFNGNGVGTGFSGGIDSFVTILDYFAKPIFKTLKITHLFFFNVGSHGMGHTDEELERIRKKFWARYHTLKPFSDEIGIPFIPVDSNVHSFHTLGHLEGCSLVTPGAALLFQRTIKSYLLSSGGYTHADKLNYIKKHKDSLDIACTDPWINHLYSTENIQCISTGTNEDRLSKTKRLANSDFTAPMEFLNVCGARDTIDTNCSVCEKCCMTILMLDILGKTDKFQNRFDIPQYRKYAEKRYIAKVLSMEKEDPYYSEMITYAKKVNYDLEKRTTLKDKILVRFIDSPLHNFLRKNPIIHSIGKTIKDIIG
ncbi:MAG: hypothetical protein K6G44_11260 [Lentisphaeria bacterium]|nr:hypothetical protein [Lentisphaeria bacterium]